ncbi:MAG TPA: cytochrome b/b6 domain-containing protein [Candidatus Saccharimonadia bacterium]|nr:cytochrome b/b6 domain-containing protein [Candidatus Saccharimonadia bacterium]
MSALGRHLVWDLPTRVVHWLIALGVTFQWLSGKYELVPMAWHYLVGYVLLALLVFRIAWGFVGSDSARFARFVRGPAEIARYASRVAAALRAAPDDEAARHAHLHAGHNPIGAWSALALLASTLLQAISGLYASDDILAAGPFAGDASAATVAAMTAIHHANEWVLLALVVVHVAAVAWHARMLDEDLVRAMLDGRKLLAAEPALRFAPASRALALLALSIALVWLVVARA